MKPLDINKKIIFFHVNKPNDIVRSDIIKASNNCTSNADIIQIKCKPSFFDPFAPRGFINIKFLTKENDVESDIECEILPASIKQHEKYIIGAFLFLWTMICLLISLTFYSFLAVAFVWLLMVILFYLKQTLNEGKLENYIRFIFTTIKRTKTKSTFSLTKGKN